MTQEDFKEKFKAAMLISLKETFEEITGIYLDRGTSLFETLATISAEEASRPVSTNCASIAAQVAHITLYIDVILKFMRGERPKVDWDEIWNTVGAVSTEEWAASQKRLRDAYEKLHAVINDDATWEHEDAIVGGMGMLMHNAYHLGEIRQALCTIKSSQS
ncbi:MAG: DinB family protein [Chloroflexota bacterium]